MRRLVMYAALALCVLEAPAAAGERFEQWSLESQGEGTFALAFKRSIPPENSGGPGLAFVCNQDNKYVVGILAPAPGTFKSEQAFVPVAIQKSEDGFELLDLLQSWENEGEYLFLENPSEQDDLATHLKDRESEGVKSAHFYFPSDLDGGTGITNHVVIDLPGFTRGLEAFKRQCQKSP